MSDDAKSDDKGTGSEDSGKVADTDKLNALLAKWEDDGKAADKGKDDEFDVARELGSLRYAESGQAG